MIINTSSRVSEVKPYYFATKLKQVAEMNARGHDVINMGIGSPDLPPPPAVIEVLQNYADDVQAHGYQSYYGIPELRSGFAKMYQKQLNVFLDPDTEVLPLIGSKEGIMHIAMTFLEQGDQVLVPNPGYPSYKVTTELTGAEAVFYNLNEENKWLPDWSQLESMDLTRVKIMWINYPNMPTGAKANYKFYEKLVAFAKRHKILICHDNPYNFILNDTPLSIFNVPGAKDCCIELSSLSKAYNMAGWRVGALIGHPEYVSAVVRFKSNMDSGMFKPVQLAAARALDLDQEWFDSLNHIYRQRKEAAVRIFDLLDCKYESDSAGLFVWAKAPEYIQDVKEWVDEILLIAKVFITPGAIFGTNGDRYLRISLCLSEEKFEEAFNRIENTIVKSIAAV